MEPLSPSAHQLNTSKEAGTTSREFITCSVLFSNLLHLRSHQPSRTLAVQNRMEGPATGRGAACLFAINTMKSHFRKKSGNTAGLCVMPTDEASASFPALQQQGLPRDEERHAEEAQKFHRVCVILACLLRLPSSESDRKHQSRASTSGDEFFNRFLPRSFTAISRVIKVLRHVRGL